MRVVAVGRVRFINIYDKYRGKSINAILVLLFDSVDRNETFSKVR